MSGDVISVRDLAARVAHLAGRRPPRWVLPLGAVRWAQRLTPALVPSQLAPEQVRSLDRPWVFDDRKARAEFDWRPRDLATGLPPTVAHLLAPAT